MVITSSSHLTKESALQTHLVRALLCLYTPLHLFSLQTRRPSSHLRQGFGGQAVVGNLLFSIILRRSHRAALASHSALRASRDKQWFTPFVPSSSFAPHHAALASHSALRASRDKQWFTPFVPSSSFAPHHAALAQW